jgi:hypothetical protein
VRRPASLTLRRWLATIDRDAAATAAPAAALASAGAAAPNAPRAAATAAGFLDELDRLLYASAAPARESRSAPGVARRRTTVHPPRAGAAPHPHEERTMHATFVTTPAAAPGRPRTPIRRATTPPRSTRCASGSTPR